MSEKREETSTLNDYEKMFKGGEHAEKKLVYHFNMNKQDMERLLTGQPLYAMKDRSVIELLDSRQDTYAARENSDKKIGDAIKKLEKARSGSGAVEVQSHVAENDNIVMPKVIPGPKKRSEEVSDVMGGIDVSQEQLGLTWKNIFKNVEKATTRDAAKREKIDAELDEISKAYEELPKTRGAATVASVASNVVGVGLPMLIAGMLGGPEVATIVGGGVVMSDILSTMSQADMEMDAYEKASGKKLSKGQRASYTVSLAATDLIMNTLLSRGVLKGVTGSQRRELSRQITTQIFENPVAQQEFNTMTRRVLDRERKDRRKEIVRSGIEGGLSSAAMEAEKSIYTEEAPELKNIVYSALGGTLAGSAQSGLSMKINEKNLHESRMNSDEIFYASDVDNKGKKAVPIREILPTDVQPSPDGKTTEVTADVVRPGRHDAQEGKYDEQNVVRGSYAQAMKDPLVHEMYEDMQVPPEKQVVYEDMWSETKRVKGKPDYEKQNEIVQMMAADMGLPIQVYARVEDVPAKYAGVIGKSKYGGFTTEEGGTAIVLELCQGISAHNVEAVIRHETLGHKGMRRLYDNEEDYKKALLEAGEMLLSEQDKPRAKNSPKFVDGVEERGSLKAEIRPYSIHGTPNKDQKPYENYKLLYELLERSEDASRKSTVNELRKHNYSIGGYPMPQLYELEMFKDLDMDME